ncbi:hypothetical protein ACS386_00015 [Flavobacteriaceae bacterium LMO-SS05]|jgi:hypothetical protein
MKNIIYKLGLFLFAFAVFYSCTSPEAESNYTPADYEYPAGISLTSSNITNSSFEFTYTTSGGGVGYYVVLEGGSTPPSNQDVFNGTGTGLVTSGNFALNGEPVAVEIASDLCDASVYDVYAVQFTSDAFLSAAPVTITVTTNTNANIAGTYNVVSNGVMSGNFGDEVVTDYTSVVTITDNLDGKFRFSDITAGIYPDPNYYGSFGSPSVPKNITVDCNVFGGCYTSPFYNCCGDFICIDITINADGSLSVAWESAFGEVFTAEYTKQ